MLVSIKSLFVIKGSIYNTYYGKKFIKLVSVVISIALKNISTDFYNFKVNILRLLIQVPKKLKIKINYKFYVVLCFKNLFYNVFIL